VGQIPVARQGVPARTIRFGAFELDLRTEELRKGGIRLRLPGQSFQVLRMLLGHPGELVSREELRQSLWPSDTFVDFDHGLNAAVNRLRDVLGDSADNPKYIETLPKRGYRFVAPLEGGETVAHGDPSGTSDSNWSTPVSDTDPATAIVDVQSPTSAVALPGAERILSRKLSRGWLAVLIAATMILLVAIAVRMLTPAPQARISGSRQISRDGMPKSNLQTDGSRIYFSEFSNGRSVPAQVSITGGDTSLLPVSYLNYLNAATCDISADHTKLLILTWFGSEAEGILWSQPLPAGPPQRLGNTEGHDETWSPDGRELLFAKGSTYYLAAADGTSPRPFLSLHGIPNGARFSPDGSRIRFALSDPEMRVSALWEVNRDGSNLHRLLPPGQNPVAQCCGRWSPDGRYYFFLDLDSFNADWYPIVSSANIFVLREAAGGLTQKSHVPMQLTSGPLSFGELLPALDGKQLLAVASQQRGELVRYDNSTQQFVPFLSGASISDLDFSRDRQWIAYVTVPDHTLWRSREDGTERLQLTSAPVDAVLPRWSPDGKSIVYVALNSSRRLKIFQVSANGGSSEELLSENDDEQDPTWFPDGRRLVFGGLPEVSYRAGAGIRIFDFKTRRVSDIPDSKDLFSPRLSPDGRYIAALTRDSKKLVLYDFQTGKWSDWVTDSVTVGYPAWSADGRYLYFQSWSDHHTYRRVRSGETKSEVIAGLDNLHPFTTCCTSSWSGVTPDGSLLFVRDTSTQEIYALDLQLP